MNVGGCFCGAIRFEVTSTVKSVTYCHCSKCRRFHGHVGAYTASPREGFRLTEARGLKWHDVSSEVRRGFCVECGSSLFFDEKKDTTMLGICAGAFDEPTGLREKAHIYVASKGDYYAITGDLLQFDTMPERKKS